MSSALKELTEMEYKQRYQDKPNYPEYARVKRKYTDRTSSGLTRAIVDFLNLKGHFAERINTMGVPVDRRKTVTNVIGQTQQIGSVQWRRSGATRGSSDISAVVSGKTIKIEIKIGKDRQSEHQKRYQEQVEKAGGLYWLVKSYDEFIEKYNNLLDN